MKNRVLNARVGITLAAALGALTTESNAATCWQNCYDAWDSYLWTQVSNFEACGEWEGVAGVIAEALNRITGNVAGQVILTGCGLIFDGNMLGADAAYVACVASCTTANTPSTYQGWYSVYSSFSTFGSGRSLSAWTITD